MSNKDVNYTQCKLRKGNMFQMSWIPSEFAKEGKIVKLRDANDVWHDGWLVEHAYSTKSYKEVNEHSQLYKTQRKASDI